MFRPHYHELHRVGRPGVWRSIVGALLLPVLVFVVCPAVIAMAFFAGLMVSGLSTQEAATALDITQELTPTGLALLNVSLAAGIPAAWLVLWLMHRLKPGWLSSVAPRIRWPYFTACLGLSVIALLSAVAVGMVLPSSGVTMSGEPNEFTTRTRDFLLVIALLTPLQAAGEEYVFRGYLTQAFGSLTIKPLIARSLAVLGPALLFALAHGLGQSFPVFMDRLAFGIIAGILVLRTGGLEAAIAMHVLNNFAAFGLALAFSDMTEALHATAPASWWMILSTLTQSLVYLALADWVARRMGMADRGPASGVVLEPSATRV